MTREDWLQSMSERIEAVFMRNGYNITAKYRVSCGLPSKGAFSKKLRRIGEAWHKSCSEDQTCEIFISPTISDSVLVAATLAHELVHVCVGNENGHNKVFKKCAEAIGLTGKMTATVAGPELTALIERSVVALGPFPHAVLDYTGQKKQGTRMIKIECPNPVCCYAVENDKPYIVRMSRSAFEFASPICGCCRDEMREVE